MPIKRYTPEQIIHKLREAEVLLSQGKTTAEASRQIGVVQQTYYRWRKEHGGTSYLLDIHARSSLVSGGS